MNKALLDMEKTVDLYQKELLEDIQTFQTSLEAFKKTRAKRNSDRYLTLYGQMYADLTQLKNSAETVQEIMDNYDDLERLIEESKAA